MKQITKVVTLLTLALILQSCSAVKVLDSWKGDNASSMKEKNILVVARTNDTQARIAFEEEIAGQLRAKGLKATESFKKFPKLNPDEKPSDEKSEMIKTLLEREGYNGVVISVLKDYQEQTQTTTSGGGYAGGTMYPMGYPGYYSGFYGYYRFPMSYSTFGTYTPETTTTRVSKTYIVETLAYNLDLPEAKQMVAIVTSKIEDPSSVSITASDYAKLIVKSLENK